MQFIPYVSISPSKISMYSRPDKPYSGKSDAQIQNEQNLSDNSQNGEISNKARNKIEHGLNWLLFLTKSKKAFSKKSGKYFNFKIMFTTLTLSSTQQHSDNFIKKNMLNQFLTEARQKWKADKYLWRAESQKNGRIHFHIVFDKFIPWEWIKATWNRIQEKYYYVSKYSRSQHNKYKNGFFFDPNDKYGTSYAKQKKRYHEGVANGWFKPNSTDVHSIKKIRNIAAYLSKYCTKNPENLSTAELSESDNRYYKTAKSGHVREIEGNLWNLSQSLSRYKTAVEIVDNEISDEIAVLTKHYAGKLKAYDYCSVFYISIKELKAVTSFALLTILDEYVSQMCLN